MKLYFARQLVSISTRLEQCLFATFFHEDFDKNKNVEIATLKRHVATILQEVEELNLKVTAGYIKKYLLPYIDHSTAKELFDQINHIKETFEVEVDDIAFFIIPSKKLLYYHGENLCSKDVEVKLPRAYSELKEAGKCFATSRFQASVFHAMRAIEVVLKVVAKSLGIPELDRDQNWGDILNKVKSEIDKQKNCNSNWHEEKKFYESTYTYLHAIKVAWRNPTMHVENVYTDDSAEGIFNSVKLLLNQIAQKLSE